MVASLRQDPSEAVYFNRKSPVEPAAWRDFDAIARKRLS
jgi:hypothetical protein